MLAVMDTLIEGNQVYYLLDSDKDGNMPDNKEYLKSKSAFQKLAISGNKVSIEEVIFE